MWVRAVWMEKEKEIEDVVPDIWVKGDYVFWPPVANAEKAMKCRQQPTSSWRQFKLIKIKCRSESHKDCEDYDVTTTIEESSSEDEEMAGVKRKPKKKQFSDYVTAETSEVTTDVNQDMPAVTITQEPTRSTSAMLTFVTTEQDVNVAVAVCLKYAPDRRGGTGRRTVGMMNQLREPLEHERDDDINFRL